jgi:uncharacterized DUF497 family protein
LELAAGPGSVFRASWSSVSRHRELTAPRVADSVRTHEVFHNHLDEEDDPRGNVVHIAEHDLTVEEVEEVLAAPASEGVSNSTGFPAAWGYVPDGRFIIAVFEEIDADTIRVITAYEVPEPKRKSKRKKK